MMQEKVQEEATFGEVTFSVLNPWNRDRIVVVCM